MTSLFQPLTLRDLILANRTIVSPCASTPPLTASLRIGMQIPLDEGGWIVKAPSAIEHHDGELPPEALTADELAALKAHFVSAVERSQGAGIDAIELHCAHGYLMHQFLSPVANQRADEYGGSLENRVRFPLEVFRAIRAVWPAEKPLGVRLSATDWDESNPLGGCGMPQLGSVVPLRLLYSTGAVHLLARGGCSVIRVSASDRRFKWGVICFTAPCWTRCYHETGMFRDAMMQSGLPRQATMISCNQ